VVGKVRRGHYAMSSRGTLRPEDECSVLYKSLDA
jgi:hypothetical protein